MEIFDTINTDFMFNSQFTQKMVNTRAQIKKMKNTIKTENTPKILLWKASVTNSDIQMTRSGDLIGSNDDLLTEILRRIPVKSVMRFKSVSKHLQSLLSDRRFTLMYDGNVPRSPGLFVRNLYIPFDVEDRNTPPFRSLDFYPDIHGLKIAQSCNGLLLCCSDGENHRSRKYYVFNPVTKQFAVIPSGGRRTIYFMGLAFHPKDSKHYKVVCIRSTGKWNIENWELFHIQIYSSETGKWKTLNESFSGLHFTRFSSGVYWNGAIHWAPACLNPSYFNLIAEQLQTLPLPVVKTTYSIGPYGATTLPLYFGESRGHLHLVESADQENRLHVNVYEMLSDHSGWFLKYQVNLHELPVAYPEMICSHNHPMSPYYYEFEVLDIITGEKEEDSFMVVRIPGRVLRYNVHDKSFKQIFDLPKSGFFGRFGLLDVHRYTKTLTTF